MAERNNYRSIFGIAGMILPFVLAILILLYKDYFWWLGDSRMEFEVAGFLAFVGVLHALFVGLGKAFHNKHMHAVIPYIYAAFFAYFIYRTAGTVSSYIFIIIAIITYVIFRATAESIRREIEKEEVAQKITQIVQVDRLKSDFLSIAQHQLRTPLSGVKWALEMLKTDPAIPLESQSLIDQSLNRIQDSLTIINQMLKTVEDEERPSLQIEPTDIVGMVRGIIAELNFLIVKKGVKLSFICPDSLLIPADRGKLKAALLNVIDNAIKYSPKGTVGVTITEEKDAAQMVVKDSGIGIPSDDLPYIFQRLHRSKNAVLLEPDESGVGLSISQKIISLHGGVISVDSEVGKGTTVTVRLPKNN